jgi:predicted enzyme related to lactoylglutathione lyase
MSNHDLSKSRIRQVAVTVEDLPRATRFYRDTLGLPFLFEAPGLAFFQCGEVRLMLSVPDKTEFDHPTSILYYSVEDIDASKSTLEDRGAKFEGEPQLTHRTDAYELWLALFRDTEGNPLVLMEERPVAAGD